jgi:hypothetical protein
VIDMSVWQLQEEFERLAGSRRVAAAIVVISVLMILYCLPLPS